MKERLWKLLCIKSLVTLSLIFTCCWLVLKGSMEVKDFTTMALMAMTYYFSTQKSEKYKDDSEDVKEPVIGFDSTDDENNIKGENQ